MLCGREPALLSRFQQLLAREVVKPRARWRGHVLSIGHQVPDVVLRVAALAERTHAVLLQFVERCGAHVGGEQLVLAGGASLRAHVELRLNYLKRFYSGARFMQALYDDLSDESIDHIFRL